MQTTRHLARLGLLALTATMLVGTAPAIADDETIALTGREDGTPTRRFEKPANRIDRQDYTIIFKTEPPVPHAGETFQVIFKVEGRGDNPAPTLSTAHGAPLHLYIFSRDLEVYRHFEASPDSEGTLAMDCVVPYPGGHTFIASFEPMGYPTEHVRFVFWIEGSAAKATLQAEGVTEDSSDRASQPAIGERQLGHGGEFSPDARRIQPAGNVWDGHMVKQGEYTVKLQGESQILRRSSDGVAVKFQVSRDDSPIMGEDYSLVHLSAISDDRKHFAEAWGSPGADGMIEFDLPIMNAGTYLLWFEYETADGDRLTVPYYVQVD